MRIIYVPLHYGLTNYTYYGVWMTKATCLHKKKRTTLKSEGAKKSTLEEYLKLVEGRERNAFFVTGPFRNNLSPAIFGEARQETSSDQELGLYQRSQIPRNNRNCNRSILFLSFLALPATSNLIIRFLVAQTSSNAKSNSEITANHLLTSDIRCKFRWVIQHDISPLVFPVLCPPFICFEPFH